MRLHSGFSGAWLVLFATFALPGLVHAVAAIPTRVATVEARLDALRSDLPEAASDKTRRERFLRAVAEEMQRLGVGTTSVSTMHDDVLAAAIGLSVDVNFYVPGSQTKAHEALFAELGRRGAVTAVDVNDLHRTLLADRRWEDARVLSGRFPDAVVQALPELIEAGEESPSRPFAWRVSESGTSISRHPVVWPTGAALLVISHPGCGFSRRLLHVIEAEEEIASALPEFKVFLAPTFGTFDFKRIHAWNEQHPRLPHELVDRPVQWESWVSSWETPQLIFLVDGVVKERVVGWPTEGKRSEIREALERLGSPTLSPGD